MQGLLSENSQPNSEMVDVKQAGAQVSATVDRLKRIVMAGTLILYSEEAGDKFLRFLDKNDIPGSVAQVSAMVIAVLIDKSLMNKRKNGDGGGDIVPPALVVPAGAMIAADLLDYACQLYGVENSEDLTKQTVAELANLLRNGAEAGEQAQSPQAQQPEQQQPVQPAQQAMGVVA